MFHNIISNAMTNIPKIWPNVKNGLHSIQFKQLVTQMYYEMRYMYVLGQLHETKTTASEQEIEVLCAKRATKFIKDEIKLEETYDMNEYANIITNQVLNVIVQGMNKENLGEDIYPYRNIEKMLTSIKVVVQYLQNIQFAQDVYDDKVMCVSSDNQANGVMGNNFIAAITTILAYCINSVSASTRRFF